MSNLKLGGSIGDSSAKRAGKTAPPVSATGEDMRAVLALLTCLGQDGAYGWIIEDSGREKLAIAAKRRSISVKVASFAPQLADCLCSEGLARWDIGAVSGRRRLEITSVGRSRLARQSPAAGGDPFLAQHKPLKRGVTGEPNDTTPVVIDQAESPLAWLATRKGPEGKALIDPAELEAGERLRRDFTIAGMEPRLTANWSALGGGGGAPGQAITYSDMAVGARQRVEAALDFVGGDFAGLLLDVCGFLKGLETIEGERRWPRRSAKLVLTLALRQLARHYGISAVAVGPRHSGGVRHWGAGGYRPEIEPG